MAKKENIFFYGTGRRKSSIARVRLVEGNGKITINGKDIYLFKSNNDLGKQAFFEYKGYKFFIESTKLTENEFVDLIKSIIQ